jgi:hypothetical protein
MKINELFRPISNKIKDLAGKTVYKLENVK